MRAVTDCWVNDGIGCPSFVIQEVSGEAVDAGVLASGFADVIEQMILASDIGDSR